MTPPGDATTYGFDQRGNRVSVTPTGTPAQTWAFNQRDQLVASPDGATYRYDGEGLRTSLTTGATTTRFTWDRNGGLPLLLSDGTNAYVYGPSGAPLEQISTTNTTTYLHTDRLGSVRALSNATGQITATRTYDPYGNPTTTTGTYNTPFGYAGEYTDTNTGLIYLRARYYQPSSGQFINEDPAVSQTKQPYLYANGDPINRTDPSGLLVDAGTYAGSSTIGGTATAGTVCAIVEPCGAIVIVIVIVVVIVVCVFVCMRLFQNHTEKRTVFTPQHNECSEDRCHRRPPAVPASPDASRTVASRGTPRASAEAEDAGPSPEEIAAAEQAARDEEAQRIDESDLAAEKAATGASPKSNTPNVSPKPPGWDGSWQRRAASRSNEGKHWWDPDGGEWHFHREDAHHEPHWDYNPWDQWNSPWQHIPLPNPD